MAAWRIFIHSVQMIFNNLPQVVRIVLVPMGIGIATLVLFAVLGVSMDGTDSEGATGGQIAGLILLALVLIGLALWVIVAWHRFILLAEYPQGWVPMLRTDRMLSYIGHSLWLGLVMMGLMLPLFLVVGVVGGVVPLIVTIVSVVVIVAANVVFFRLSTSLPAAAIGKPLTLKEAWTATEGSSATILILVLILGVAQFALQLLLGLLLLTPVIGAVLMVLGTVVSGLVNISILTTLYGYYIEKRAL
ncbi:threonine dehydratase [Roseovarius mucosus]|uniref:threonine dehydratase n=1 Tax=Roseovarius mucosus TaxID=215743 RepID=UPI003BAC1C9F